MTGSRPDLGYQAAGLVNQAKVGIFAGSLASGIAGATVLLRSRHKARFQLQEEAEAERAGDTPYEIRPAHAGDVGCFPRRPSP